MGTVETNILMNVDSHADAVKVELLLPYMWMNSSAENFHQDAESQKRRGFVKGAEVVKLNDVSSYISP